MEKKLKRVKKITQDLAIVEDRLGKKIDPLIFKTVIWLNVFGINTEGSCAGHKRWGLPWPWIEIGAKNRPKEEWEGEKKAFKKAAKENNVSYNKLIRGEPDDLFWKVIAEIIKNPKTDEYIKWEKNTTELLKCLKILLNDFYKKRKVPKIIKLRVVDSRLQSFNLPNEADYAGWSSKRRSQLRYLNKRRKEMRDFAKYLEGRHYND